MDDPPTRRRFVGGQLTKLPTGTDAIFAFGPGAKGIATMSIKEILERMGKLNLEIRALAGTSDKWNAEDESKWAEINKTYDELRGQKEKIEEAAAIQTRAASVEAYEAEQRSSFGVRPNDSGDRRDDASTEEDLGLSFQAWATGGQRDITERQAQAVERTGFPVHRGVIDLDIRGDAYGSRGWAAPSRIQQIQQIMRCSHPSMAAMRIDEWRSRQIESMHRNEKRALSVGTTTAGGFTVPEGFVNQLEISLLAFGGMMQVAEIMDTATGNDLPWPTVNDTGNEGEIIAEGGSIGSSVDPVFGQIIFKAYKFSSKLIQISTELLEDSAFNMASLLGGFIGTRIGRHGNNKFTLGSGSSEPTGIVTAASVGVTTTTNAALEDVDVVELVHSVDPAYRVGPSVGFMMHDNIILEVRKLKDANDQFIWRAGLELGTPDRLLGYPVTVNQNMASALATTAKIMVFGDLSKYKIRRVRSIRLRRLDELYAANDQVGFVGFIRMDGNLLDAGTDPIKLMDMAV